MKKNEQRGVFALKISKLREAATFGKNGVPMCSASYLQKIENQNVIPSGKMILKLATAFKYSDTEHVDELRRLAEEQRRDGIKNRIAPQSRLGGVLRVSVGSSRTEAFRQLSLRAQKRVVILGIGMTNITKYAIETLKQIASRVPIDFLVIDPEALASQLEFANKLQDFLGLSNFAAQAQESYNILRNFCRAQNSHRNTNRKLRLRVYDTIPTTSMVMIDPDHKSGELEVEVFLHQSGEFRPRFAISNTPGDESLFALFHQKFKCLWKQARCVV